MSYRLFATAVICGALLLGACIQEGTDGPQQTGMGPATAPAAASTRPGPADNSFCFVCHANYKKEKLTVRHAKAGVGCMKCHGSSDKHSSDEDGLTPPEIMYAKAAVNPACMACHARAKIQDVAAHKPVLAATAAAPKVCTDCHGRGHRLKVRTRRWDKTTGKLIADDGVRMTTTAPSSEE